MCWGNVDGKRNGLACEFTKNKLAGILIFYKRLIITIKILFESALRNYCWFKQPALSIDFVNRILFLIPRPM